MANEIGIVNEMYYEVCRFCRRGRLYAATCQNSREMEETAIDGDDTCLSALANCGGGERGIEWVREMRNQRVACRDKEDRMTRFHENPMEEVRLTLVIRPALLTFARDFIPAIAAIEAVVGNQITVRCTALKAMQFEHQDYIERIEPLPA